MFVFFVLMLLLAVWTDNSKSINSNDKIVESKLVNDNILMNNEVLSDNILKK